LKADVTRHARRSTAPFKTETVWNAGLAGTGVAVEGQSLTVGHEGDWVPEHLLLLAAESCFMSTLLTLAVDAGIDVLGYVSKGSLDVPRDPGQASLLLSPCAVVATTGDAERLTALGRQAQRDSIVARMLGDRFRVELDVRTLPSEAAE